MPCTLEILLKLAAESFRNTIKNVQFILLKNSLSDELMMCPEIIHKSKIQDDVPEPALDFDC